MSLISVIVVLVILGLVLWVIQTFLPLDARIKNIIMVIAVIFVCIWILQGMGWIGSVRGGSDITIR